MGCRLPHGCLEERTWWLLAGNRCARTACAKRPVTRMKSLIPKRWLTVRNLFLVVILLLLLLLLSDCANAPGPAHPRAIVDHAQTR